MSATTPPGLQTAPPTGSITSPLSFTATGPTSSFIKVYCGKDECVPLSKQCTGGVFQGALAELATRVSKHEALAQSSRSRRAKTIGSAAAADSEVPVAVTAAGNSSSVGGKGEATPPAAESRAGAAGHSGGVGRDGGTRTEKQPSAPLSSTSASVLSASKGRASPGPSTAPLHTTATSLSIKAADAPAGDVLAGVDDVRMACGAVYRRAELLPLSFVRDVASNSKVTVLYRQHLQLQEQLRRHQLEQQQLQQQGDEGEDVAATMDSKASEDDAAYAESSQRAGGRVGGKGVKSHTNKVSPRRRGMPSVYRGGSSVSSGPTSAAAAAALAAQIRTQLWAALRNTIPFFGVLAMPVHTSMEPLISLPAMSSGGGASATAARAAAPTPTTTTPPAAGMVSGATAVCSGSYVLLGCRERPRKAALAGETAPMFSPAAPYASAAQSVIGGVAAYPNISAVERLVEQANEASVVRLPPLCSDAVLRSTGAAGDSAKRSPRKPRSHPRDLQGHQVLQQSLPARCTLQPNTNRVVPMPLPLPDDIAACYSAARLVTKPLGQSAAAPNEDVDDSTALSGTHASGDATHSHSRGHSGRTRRRSLDEHADILVSTADVSAAAGSRPSLDSGRGASLTWFANSAKGGGGGGGGAFSDELSVEGGEEAILTATKRPFCAAAAAAAASRGFSSPCTSPRTNLAAGPSGSLPKDGDGLAKEAEPSVPLSAVAIARLMPSTRFTVQLSSCAVSLTAQTRKGAGGNAAGVASGNTTSTASSATAGGAVDNYADELAVVFDGLDVLWHGANGEEALLQWVLDEYSILLKQRMAAAIAQWTSMVRAGDPSSGAAAASSSKANKMRCQASKGREPRVA
nr:unnamed protein product [Leishmania braziliensis]